MTSDELRGYFQRIGYGGTPSPDLETLQTLHRLHTQAIPFENLNSLLGIPVRLDLPSLWEKLVRSRRGGYCFEQNLLFRSVLQAIGFRVTGLAARVVWNAPEGAVPPRTHMLLRIDLDGRPWLADVGFGGQVLTAAIQLEPGIEQATPHEPFRLVPWNDELLLESRIRERWLPLYRFHQHPQELADYEVSNWYVSTSPESIFVNGLMASRVGPGVRYALMNNELAVHRSGGPSEKRVLGHAAELRQVLEHEIGLSLPDAPGLEPLLKRLTTPAA